MCRKKTLVGEGKVSKKYVLLICLLVSAFLLSFSVSAANAVSLVDLQINEELLPGEDYLRLTATGVFSHGVKQQISQDLTWTSSDTAIAKVDSTGTVRFTGKGGPVTIAVHKDGVSGSKSINVKPWPKSIEIETSFVYSENPYRLLVKGRFSDGTTRYFGPEDQVVWASSNPWVAWVNSQGVVTFTGEEGYVVVKVITGTYSDSVNLTVDKQNNKDTTVWRKGIKIKEEIKYSPEQQKLTLVAVMTDDSEEAIPNSSADWSSSNPEIAKVNNEGELTFSGKAGFTTLKVSYGGYHYETLVKVGRTLIKLALNQSLNYTSVWEEIAFPLSVTATYNDGTEIIQTSGLNWSVSDPKLATITETGVITFTGEPGTATVTVSGSGNEGAVVQDAVTVEIPVMEKSRPQRLYIDVNPLKDIREQGIYSPEVMCIFSNGERRDVTEQVTWTNSSPETATIYNKKIYLAPNPGKVELRANFRGLSDTVSGYGNWLPGYKTGRVYQLRIKEHQVPFSFSPVKLAALAVGGDGSIQDMTAQVKWRSSQPLVARVNKGVLTYTGRIGKTVITAQGFGFRDFLQVEVCPEDLQPRVDKLVIEGNLWGGANQLKVTAYFNNGTVKEVTKEAVWNTGNKNVAVVTNQGNVMFPKGMAPVTIFASYGGKEAKIARI